MTRLRPITARQVEILVWFCSYTQREGLPPTVREVAAAFGITPRAAWDHLMALERKGKLRRRAGERCSRRWIVVAFEDSQPGHGV